jgi:hypothetical protein
MSGMDSEMDGSQRAEYGTREGDMWLAPGSPIQDRLDQEGKGHVLIHEMMVKDGELQEVIYVTALPELIEQATQGHERYVEALAERN